MNLLFSHVVTSSLSYERIIINNRFLFSYSFGNFPRQFSNFSHKPKTHISKIVT